MIRQPEEFNADFKIDCDVAIVGSGPGGAAAAYKLTQLGRRVAVFEAGGHFKPSDFRRDGTAALKNLYQDAGQRFTRGNVFFATMFGKGVGGGTLVNSGISFTPPDKAVERWSQEAKLADFTPGSLRKYVDEVRRNVNIETLSLDRLGRNNSIFKEGLDKLSFKGAVIPRNTKGCAACGRCFFGCTSGAKQSMDKNFIASAVAGGAEVYTYAQVSGLQFDANKKRFEGLTVQIIDRETGQSRATATVRAKHVVLAAGAIGTPKLLLESGACNSSGQVGRNFRCHPSVGVLGDFAEEINSHQSVMQGYFSDEFFESDEILLETFWAPLGVVSTFVPGFGDAAVKNMTGFKHLAGSGGMIRDTSSGNVRFVDGLPDIEYQVNEFDQRRLTQALFRSAEVLLAAGAKRVFLDVAAKPEVQTLSELRSFFSEHQNLGPDIIREGNHGMGTCRMGETKSSVVNSYGRSHDVSNLAVLDVSAFPGALGVNPSITAMALALRGAEYLDANFQ